MTVDAYTAHGVALRTVQGLEAQAAAVALLRRHDGETAAEASAARAAEKSCRWRDAESDLAEARELLGLEPDRDDVGAGIEDFDPFADVLEVRVEGYRDAYGDTWTSERVMVLLGYGGPTIRLYFDGSSAHVEAYWGGDSHTCPVITGEAVDMIACSLGEALESVR
jgi:hypothetical protein